MRRGSNGCGAEMRSRPAEVIDDETAEHGERRNGEEGGYPAETTECVDEMRER